MKKASLYLLILTISISILSGVIWAEELAAPVADGTAVTSNETTWSLSETAKGHNDLGSSSLSGLAVPNYYRGEGGFEKVPGASHHRRRSRGHIDLSFDDSRVGLVMLVTALAIIVVFGSETYYD
jgi:hypothetical protein